MQEESKWDIFCKFHNSQDPINHKIICSHYYSDLVVQIFQTGKTWSLNSAPIDTNRTKKVFSEEISFSDSNGTLNMNEVRNIPMHVARQISWMKTCPSYSIFQLNVQGKEIAIESSSSTELQNDEEMKERNMETIKKKLIVTISVFLLPSKSEPAYIIRK
jgi:hypothetical protein